MQSQHCWKSVRISITPIYQRAPKAHVPTLLLCEGTRGTATPKSGFYALWPSACMRCLHVDCSCCSDIKENTVSDLCSGAAEPESLPMQAATEVWPCGLTHLDVPRGARLARQLHWLCAQPPRPLYWKGEPPSSQSSSLSSRFHAKLPILTLPTGSEMRPWNCPIDRCRGGMKHAIPPRCWCCYFDCTCSLFFLFLTFCDIQRIARYRAWSCHAVQSGCHDDEALVDSTLHVCVCANLLYANSH